MQRITLSFWFLALAVIFFAKGTEAYHLPDTTYPVHYDIKLTTNVHVGETLFQGKVIIDIVVAKTTNSIYLHSHRQKIYWAIIKNILTGETEVLYDDKYTEHFLILKRKDDQQFSAGTRWKLTISYSNYLNENDTKKGFYLFKYFEKESDIHYLAATNFESAMARHAFPCYDEPHIRATFTITINHGPTYTAISNMLVDETRSSLTKTVFLKTLPMPTYLLYFTVSDFGLIEEDSTGVLNRIYLPFRMADQHSVAISMPRKIEYRLSQYFDTELAVPKIDYVAIPGSSKISKNDWGWKMYDKEEGLYEFNVPQMFTEALKNTFIDIAREICNRFLGDNVTIKRWTDLWVRESIVSLLSFRAMADIYPEWDAWQDFYINYQKALERDTDYYSRPLNSDVQTIREVANLYDDILYYKSPSVLFMWKEALTEKVFQKGLQNFLTQNKKQAVGEQQLFNAIQRTVEEENLKTPATISEMIGSWTRQSGYPILNVARNYDKGMFTVKQDAYHGDVIRKDTKVWYVPINYAVASNPDFGDTKATHYFMNATEMIVGNIRILKRDWLILNKQSTGYYRVNYDKENWDLIIEGLIDNPFTIHYRNRAQLLDDAFHLSDFNLLDHSIPIKLMTYLKQEYNYNVWYTAFGIITKYERYLRAHEKFDDFKYFVGEIVKPIYKKLGIHGITGESDSDKLTRKLVIDIACAFGVRDCLRETTQKIKDTYYNQITIDYNLQDTIFTNGLRQASNEVFELFYQNLITYSNRDNLIELSYHLSYTQDKNQMKKLIYRTVDMSEIMYNEEFYTVLESIYSKSDLGLLTCIEFLNEKWDAYGSIQKPNSNPLIDDILGMASFVVSKSAEQQLLALVDKVKNSKYVLNSVHAHTLKKEVETKIAKNFRWLEKHAKNIMTWVSKYRSECNQLAVCAHNLFFFDKKLQNILR